MAAPDRRHIRPDRVPRIPTRMETPPFTPRVPARQLRSNGYGGTATHTAGQGTSASNAYGGSAYHAEGSGETTMSNGSGGTATHYQGVGTVGTTSSGPNLCCQRSLLRDDDSRIWIPSSGRGELLFDGLLQLRWLVSAGAAVAGAAVGVAVGATVASANAAAATSNAYAAGVATGAATASASNAAAYNAGVAAGASSASYSMGEIVATAPTGCATPAIGGMTYYLCGNTWLQPAYGANGVYYRVVPAP